MGAMNQNRRFLLVLLVVCVFVVGISAFNGRKANARRPPSNRNMKDLEDLIGKELGEFTNFAQLYLGVGSVRVIERDGEVLNITKDIRRDRLNIRTITEGDKQIVIGVVGFH